jgi:DNA (cytosine-5)-methyltransferase 1
MMVLDGCCMAGGMSNGLVAAGHQVEGVDKDPQPRYPYTFHQANILEVLEDRNFMSRFDFAHVSPPCQRDSRMSDCRPGLAASYPRLIGPVRDRLKNLGIPYSIENPPPRAPLRNDLTLCGRMFGKLLYRHRVFEFWDGCPAILPPWHPPHTIRASRAGHYEPGTIMSVAGHVAPIAVAREIMGIDWMTRDELTEAVPPCYGHWIGARLGEWVRDSAKAA